MPITLGCPSCGKRFRARDESAGKKVKCPYCQAAVQVPTPEEAASAGAPTAPLPPPPDPIPTASRAPSPPAPPRPAPPPPNPVVATPADWGALPTSPPPPPHAPASSDAPLPVMSSEPSFPPMSTSSRGGRDRDRDRDRERPRPAKSKDKEKGKASQKTPDEVLAAAWKRVRRGLFWVQFGLLWLSLIGFVGLGKTIYSRQQGPLPKGDGADWVSIEGFINAPGPNSIPVKKEQMIDLACYGGPVILASILIVIGRLVASGGPRMSGSRGLFALSSLFGLLGFISLVATYLFAEAFPDYSRYAWSTFLIIAPLAELWFLIAITASGLALKRPQTARAVGFLAFLGALGAFAGTLGWELYKQEVRAMNPGEDWPLYQDIAFTVAWLLMILAYWRSVRNVRVAAREFIDTVREKE